MGGCILHRLLVCSVVLAASGGVSCLISRPCSGPDVRSPCGGNCRQQQPVGERDCDKAAPIYGKVLGRVSGLRESFISRDQPRHQQQQHWQQQFKASSLRRRQPTPGRERASYAATVVAAFGALSTHPLTYDIDLALPPSSSSSSRHSQGSNPHTIPRPTSVPASLWSWLTTQTKSFASHRRSLLQLATLGDMSSTLAGTGLNSNDLAAGLGSDDNIYAAYYNTLMGQDSNDDAMLQNSVLGYDNGYSSSYGSPVMQGYGDQQGMVNAKNNFAASVAPAQQGALAAVQDVHQVTNPLLDQAHTDIKGLASQAAAATPSAKASMVEGLGTAISTVHPYIQNGKTGPVDVATRAITQAAISKGQFMHGTAVPMASGAITAYSDVGNHLGNGFAQGYPEGYQAAMDRRAPYSDADSQQQLYQQQPSLYLPNSFSPLGSMANITYPCPQGPFGSTAPVGTIIGPGIPCGVNIMMVPRRAMPTNQVGPTVVQPIPTEPPVIVPPSPEPTPIPVNPLPPGAPPGGTTLPPNIQPPNVRPPTPPEGTTPAPTPIPTTPGAPPTTAPTTPGTTTPTLPPGLSPPNVRPASLSSYNYMSYDLPQQPLQQPQQKQELLEQSQPVAVSGPYAGTAQAATASRRVGGYSTRRQYYQAVNSRGLNSRGSSTLRQQLAPSLLSMMGRRLTGLGWD